MRQLWSKTAKLFLNYPILWLPYVCAQLLNASLNWLRRAAVFHWLAMTTRRSVPGGISVPIYGSTASAKFAWVSGVTSWSLRYLTLCIEVVALVVTAALVTMIVRGEQPRLKAALAELRNYPKRILGYSLKLYLLVAIFAIFVSLPALRLLHWVTYSTATTGWWSQVANFALMRGQAFVSLVLFAWIITPVTIRLLRLPGAEPPSADEKKLGRYFVILTGIGALVLGPVFLTPLVKLVPLRAFPEQVYASLASIVLSFPFLLGDIGVALIATCGDLNLGEPFVYRKWRQLIRVLAPLHFNKREGL